VASHQQQIRLSLKRLRLTRGKPPTTNSPLAETLEAHSWQATNNKFAYLKAIFVLERIECPERSRGTLIK